MKIKFFLINSFYFLEISAGCGYTKPQNRTVKQLSGADNDSRKKQNQILSR